MTYFFRLHIPSKIVEKVPFTLHHFEGKRSWTLLQAYQKVNEWNTCTPHHWKFWI